MRLPVSLLCLVLAACSQGEGTDEERSGAGRGEIIACATGGAARLAPVCTVERVVEKGWLMLVIHHEDGGFRRLSVRTDGSGVAAADGADPALITVRDGEIALAIGADRYILPATIAGKGAEMAGHAVP